MSLNITKPTLLVDKAICVANIEKMAKKAARSNSCLRPHFKTHHSAEIGNWFREFGVDKCTVSSVSMATYFTEHGWDDITIAFPYNPLESDQINELASKIQLNILLESSESFELAKKKISCPVGYFIKIDVGTHRTGIDPRNEALIGELALSSNETLNFKGFLAHAGHTYGAKDEASIRWIYEGAIKSLNGLKEKFGGIISYGDTPSCSLIESFDGIEELRPGNFVFFDWMQHEIGSCTIDQIGVCMACPVVAIHKERNEVVVLGGAVHLSKDLVMEGSSKCFGKAVSLTQKGWNTEVIGNMVRISQEHGILELTENMIARVKIGDLIGVIPVHSCLTADLQGHYLSTIGERIDKIIKN